MELHAGVAIRGGRLALLRLLLPADLGHVGARLHDIRSTPDGSAQGRARQGQPSTPSGSAQTVQVFEGGKRTKISSYSKDHYLSLPSVPTHVTRRQEKALIALRPEATRALERLEE